MAYYIAGAIVVCNSGSHSQSCRCSRTSSNRHWCAGQHAMPRRSRVELATTCLAHSQEPRPHGDSSDVAAHSHIVLCTRGKLRAESAQSHRPLAHCAQHWPCNC
eukprot:scaffold281896_cov34-Tisochrysis_lutea.AAC.4